MYLHLYTWGCGTTGIWSIIEHPSCYRLSRPFCRKNYGEHYASTSTSDDHTGHTDVDAVGIKDGVGNINTDERDVNNTGNTGGANNEADDIHNDAGDYHNDAGDVHDDTGVIDDDVGDIDNSTQPLCNDVLE